MSLFFTKHALDKLEVLERHQFPITKSQVEETLGAPDTVDDSRAPLLFAEKALTATHALRVAYRVENGVQSILTFYPVKRKNDD